jgi:hypothetical protein
VDGVDSGVYFGWASVGRDVAVHRMVMNIGWNPVFDNKEKSVVRPGGMVDLWGWQECGWLQESHVLHSFDEDFYGSEIRVVVGGYLRGEVRFDSLGACRVVNECNVVCVSHVCFTDELKAAIREDIRVSCDMMDSPAAKGLLSREDIASFLRRAPDTDPAEEKPEPLTDTPEGEGVWVMVFA